MGVAGGIENLPWLFTATLVGMLALNLPFAYLVKRMPRARFVPITYRFFAANILAFALTLYLAPRVGRVDRPGVLRLAVDLQPVRGLDLLGDDRRRIFERPGQAPVRLHRGGATLGAIAGSATTAILAKNVPTWGLMLCAVVLLEIAVFCMRGLAALSTQLHEVPGRDRSADDGQDRTIGGSVLAASRGPSRPPTCSTSRCSCSCSR